MTETLKFLCKHNGAAITSYYGKQYINFHEGYMSADDFKLALFTSTRTPSDMSVAFLLVTLVGMAAGGPGMLTATA